MAQSGDLLHLRFKRRLLALAIAMFCFFGAVVWMDRVGHGDLTRPSVWRLFIVAACAGVVTFAATTWLTASALLIYRKARADPAALAAFNDEFHRGTEKSASLVALVALMLTLVVLAFVGAFTTALTVVDAVMIALSICVASFVGSYLYFERGV